MTFNTLLLQEISVILATFTYTAADITSMSTSLLPVLCQPNPSKTVPSTCANVLCSKNTVCKMVNSVGCRYGNSPCKQYPVCLPHNRTCDAVKCKAGQKCVLREVICITTPCYPQAICENSCPPNEQWRTCPTRCELTCKEQQRICDASCDSIPKCQCNFGFYRKNNKTCVPIEQCSDSKTCANVKCASPNVCVMVTPNNCGKNCTKYPRCVPPDNICTRGYCSADETCEMQEILCIIAPCWPIPTCIPSTNKCLKPNEMYRQCPTKCERSCTNSNISCRPICKPACQCKDKWYRDPSGNCVQNCSTAAREG